MHDCPHCSEQISETDIQNSACPHCGGQLDAPQDRPVGSDTDQTFLSDEFDEPGDERSTFQQDESKGDRTLELDSEEAVRDSSDTDQTFLSDDFDEPDDERSPPQRESDRTLELDSGEAVRDDGIDRTILSDDFDDNPAGQATYQEDGPQDGASPIAGTDQTFLSDEADDDASDKTFMESESSGRDRPNDTANTFLSDDVDEIRTSGDSGDVGGTDATFISDDELNEKIQQSLQQNWPDATDPDMHPGMSIKGREQATPPASSTLVIKSKVFETTKTADSVAEPEYELINVLGKGGMGVVYEARQTSIDRSVAIKMLDSRIASGDKHRQKFLAEAVVTGELDHPNVVPIYDVGLNSRGMLFYAMKKVQGTPWSEVVRDKSLAENLDILMRVADAVAFAHSRGVVHRDLKPENVMLGDFGEVLVMDWGLAQPTQSFRKSKTIGNVKTIGGTPCYMAPEMVLGAEGIGPASDIYLLGAILYEVLTEKPPHVASNVKKCLKLAAKNVIEPTDKQGELIELALKAMATQPKDRFASVQEFQAAIRDYQSHTESIALAALAEDHLTQATGSSDYQTFAKALFGFEEALTLWSGNSKAKSGASRARLEYAECAVGKDDLELADSLLSRDQPEHKPLLAVIGRKQAERTAHRRRLKLFRWLAAGFAAVAFLSVSGGFFLVREQRDIATDARQVAEDERGRAEQEREKAVESLRLEEIAKQQALAAQLEEKRAKDAAIESQKQEEIAKNNAIEAQKQEEIAKNEALDAQRQEELAKQAAIAAKEQEEAAKLVAIDARNVAIAEKRRADAAKEAEEYEAYVARIGLAAAKIDENAFDSARALLEACPPALRQWEWGRLMFLCSQSQRSYPSPTPLNALALSPDNRRFATAGWDGDARVWDVEEGKLVVTLNHGGQELHAVAFSPDGRYIATAGDTPTQYIKLWSADSGEPQPRAFRGQSDTDRFASEHTDVVVGLEFSHDGRRLLSASFDGTARVWDVDSGRQLARLHGHNWWVWSAAFCPNRDEAGKPIDENRIVTCGQDGTAIVWTDETASWSEAANIEQGIPFRGHDGPVYAAAFTPDGREVVTAGYDHQLLIWRPDDVIEVDYVKLAENVPQQETPSRALSGHTDAVRSFAFSPDGRLLVSCGNDNTVRVWNVEDGRSIRTFRGHGSRVQACVFSHDARWILSTGYDSQVRRWSIEGDDEIHILQGRPLEGHLDAVLAAHFSPDGSRIVTASQDRQAKSWQSSSGEELRTYAEGHGFLASSVLFFPDAKKLVTSALDNTTRIWDVAAGVELHRLDGTGRSAALALTPDGSRIVTGSDDNSVRVWNAEDGTLLRSLEGHAFDVTAIAVSNDDPTLAITGDASGRCLVWNLETGQIVQRLYGRYSGHSRQVVAAAFLPGGRRVLTASADRTVAQWDLATGEELPDLLLKHPAGVTSMQLGPDGRLAVTGCADGIVRTWDPASAILLKQRPMKAGRWSIATNTRRVMERKDVNAATLAEQSGLKRSLVESLLGGGVESSPDVLAALARGLQVDVSQLQKAVPNALAISKNGSVAAVNAADRTLTVWDLTTDDQVLHKSFPYLIWSAAFDPNSETAHLALIGGNETRMIDIATGEERLTLGPHAAVASASFSPNGQRIVTGSWDNSARIWDAATGKDLVKLEGGHTAAINHCAFSPDAAGRYVLTASDDGTAILWEIATERNPETAADGLVGRVVKTFRGHTGRVGYAAFSPDGRFVVTASDDKTAMIWSTQDDSAEPDPLCRLRGHEWAVLSAAFSADGQRLITGSADKTARIWSISQNQTGDWEAHATLKLEGHTASVSSVAFSPLVDNNGNGTWDEGEPNALRALTASEDNTVKLWDTRDGADAAGLRGAKEILTLTEHDRAVTSVAFSPDGGQVLTGSRDGRAILWHSVDWRSSRE